MVQSNKNMVLSLACYELDLCKKSVIHYSASLKRYKHKILTGYIRVVNICTFVDLDHSLVIYSRIFRKFSIFGFERVQKIQKRLKSEKIFYMISNDCFITTTKLIEILPKYLLNLADMSFCKVQNNTIYLNEIF